MHAYYYYDRAVAVRAPPEAYIFFFKLNIHFYTIILLESA